MPHVMMRNLIVMFLLPDSLKTFPLKHQASLLISTHPRSLKFINKTHRLYQISPISTKAVPVRASDDAAPSRPPQAADRQSISMSFIYPSFSGACTFFLQVSFSYVASSGSQLKLEILLPCKCGTIPLGHISRCTCQKPFHFISAK